MWTSTSPMSTKIVRVALYCGGTLPTKSRDLMTSWLRDKEKTLYLDFHITYDYQIWQNGNLGWEDPTHQITRPFHLTVT